MEPNQACAKVRGPVASKTVLTQGLSVSAMATFLKRPMESQARPELNRAQSPPLVRVSPSWGRLSFSWTLGPAPYWGQTSAMGA